MNQASSGKARLTASFVHAALRRENGLQLKVSGPESVEFTAVTTDSRKVPRGSLFVAIRGENFDGNQFIAPSFKGGAAGAIGEVAVSANGTYFQVSDSLGAFRALAREWRASFDMPVVGVAGSNGKTTSKEFLSAILSGKYGKVWKTQGSQNGFVGIPMTLLELTPDHQAAVIEIGIDEVGAMEKHLAIVQPTAALLTSIGPEHLEKLGDVETVAREEAVALSRTHASGGLVAVHLDDPYIRPLWDKLQGGRKLGYTLEPRPGLSGEIYTGTSDAKTLTVSGGKLKAAFTLPLPLRGRHNAMNLLGATALALGLGLTPDEIRRGLDAFEGAEGRSEVRELADGTVVLCDYYNASPPSVSAGLDLLQELAHGRRRFACLADMKELGPDELKFHRGLAPKILAQKVENVFLFGDRMKHLEDELKKGGFRGERLAHFASREALAAALVSAIKPGDAVLVKGSHSMKMEEVYGALSKALKLA